MMLALAVLDLPFESPKHTTKAEGGQLTLTAGGPLIVFHKEIKPATAAKDHSELLVTQNFYRHGDRYREEGNEKFDKYVTEEFLAGVVYGANIVVTNPTSSPQKLELLLQIPQGALPGARQQGDRQQSAAARAVHDEDLRVFLLLPRAGREAVPALSGECGAQRAERGRGESGHVQRRARSSRRSTRRRGITSRNTAARRTCSRSSSKTTSSG